MVTPAAQVSYSHGQNKYKDHILFVLPVAYLLKQSRNNHGGHPSISLNRDFLQKGYSPSQKLVSVNVSKQI